MKLTSLLTLLLFLNISFNINAQERPQKVYSLVKVQHDLNWYTEQYELWEKELQKNPKNADGWLSFYTAARMAKIFSREQAKPKSWQKNYLNINQLAEHFLIRDLNNKDHEYGITIPSYRKIFRRVKH